MSKRMLLLLFLAGFLAISFTCEVDARGGVFTVEPMQEVIDSIELTVSDTTSADVCGNVSVVDGFIDFYATSPSGIVLLCYNKTAFDAFKFAAKENGTYVMHLANTWSTNNVTAKLSYGVNWEITLQAKINIKFSTDVATETFLITPSPPSTPVNILEILQIISLVATIIYTVLEIFGIKLYMRRKKKVEYIQEFGTLKNAHEKQKQCRTCKLDNND